jgi:plastocyanin
MRRAAGRRTRLSLVVPLAIVGAVAAACTGGEDPGAQQQRTAKTGAAPEVTENAEGILNDQRLTKYLDEAATIAPPASDAAAPDELPATAGGASGYTRYVFREYEGQVLTSLVEGPQGRQRRCQDPGLPCSYEDLRGLAASSDPIPEDLGLSRTELDSRVGQLDAAAAAVEHYADPDTACADGFRSDRTQTPNMGTHFSNMGRILDGEFVAGEPEIIMYARPDGAAPGGQLGQCSKGVWEGEELEAVAAAYILFTGETGGAHPETFSGDFDNWHVHYNLCRGSGVDSIAPRDVCRAAGGTYYETLGWMIHAWVSPEHDNDLGVFSMWNPTLWPISNEVATKDRVSVRPDTLEDDAAFFSISNFAFGRIRATAGSPVVIANTDSVPHTVTAGSKRSQKSAAAEFDSGVFAPGDTYKVVIEKPGRYPYFCALHPDMQGTIVVT